MNYSNMIEEKNLKKTFIVATLVSTIMGTFITGINLFERVGEKRNQKKRDKSQDDKLKELEQKLNNSQNQNQNNNRGPGRREQDLQHSLQDGGPMIRREYDRDYARLGPRFADGDIITQNQLQSQVIMLQSTVINLLEGALHTGRIEDINKLYNASEFARDGSIRALRDQYQRMLQAAPVQRPHGPVRRISSTPALSTRSGGGRPSKARSIAKSRGRNDQVTEINEERAEPTDQTQRGVDAVETTSATHMFDTDGDLFCSYATSLQKFDEPLHSNFTRDGSLACPGCGTRIAIQPSRSWRIDKELVHEKKNEGRFENERIEERTYFVSNRFIVKCHRPGAGFACILCFKYRDSDTLCENTQRFINHIWKKHSYAEYEADGDIEEKALYEQRVSKRYPE